MHVGKPPSSRPLFRKQTLVISAALLASLAAAPLFAQTQNSTWTDGGNDSLWSDASNWNPSGAPNNGSNGFTDYNVTIGAPAPTDLNVNVTIDSATISTGGVLDILGSSALTLNDNVDNNGTIVVNSNVAFAATSITFEGGTLNGTGVLLLNYDGATSTAAVNGSLTLGSSQTIQGQGQINAAVTNNGTIDANVGSQTLTVAGNMTNNNVLEATNNATLALGAATITQVSPGQIDADGGTVTLSNTTISGGTLASSSGAFYLAGETGTLNNLTNNAAFNTLGSTNLDVTGTLTDNGTITINSNQAFSATSVAFAGGTLTGTGVLVLNDGSTSATAAVNGSLTQGASHTIAGQGQINAAVTNNGTIDANVGSQTLTVAGNMTNNNVLEATNNATLALGAATITQVSPGQIDADGGTVTLSNTTISGGTLASSSGAFYLAGETGTLNNLTNNAAFNTLGSTNLDVTGTLTDNGTITINSNKAFSATSVAFAGGTLTGTGVLVLNDDASATTAAVNGSLTQGASHTIAGQGQINAAVINDGTIDANVGSHTMTIAGTFTNDGVLEASNGGTLAITTGNITQGVGGEIDAAGGTVVFQNSPSLTGGTINGSGDGLVILLSGTGSLTNVTNNAAVDALGATALDVSGTLSNNGTITINSNQAFSSTNVTFAGGTLNGTGVLVLNDDASATTAALNGSLTQGASHTIAGQGQINAAVTNNGTIDANVGSHSLTIAGTFTNDGVLEASNGGTLAITTGNITQGVGGEIDAAGGTVVFQNSPSLTGGTINGSGDGLVILLSGTGSLTNVTNNAAVNSLGATALDVSGTLNNNGTITINSNQAFVSTGVTVNGGSLNGTGDLVLNDDASATTAALNGSLTQGASHTIAGQGQINATVINNGTVDANVASHTLTIAGSFTNDGVMQASNGGTLLVDSGVLTNQSGLTLSGGTYEVDSNSTINMVGAAFTTNAANIIINGTGTSFTAIAALNTNSGLFHLENGASFNALLGLSNSGTVLINSTSDLGLPVGSYSQSSGLTQVDGSLTTSTFNLIGGTLKGTGDIAATVNNTGGTINPGDSPGELTVGSFSQGSGGTLDVEVAGTGTGQFDVLAVIGSAQLGGTVDVIPLNGFVPQPGETFTFLTAGSLSGTFANLSAPPGYALNYTSNSVFLTVPEPTSLSLWAASAGLLATRRRRVGARTGNCVSA